MDTVSSYLIAVILTTAQQLLFLFAPILALALVMHSLAHSMRVHVARLIGLKPFIYGTAPGTVVHELGHAFFCLLFRHRIDYKGSSLFCVKPDGTLGSIRSSFNPRSKIQTMGLFFIGTGPIWFGGIVLFLASRILLGSPFSGEAILSLQDTGSSLAYFAALPFNLLGLSWMIIRSVPQWLLSLHWQGFVFLYLALAVGSHMWMSPSDLRTAVQGGGVLLGCLLAFNLMTGWMKTFQAGVDYVLSMALVQVYATMVFALACNGLLVGVLWLMATIRGPRR